MKFIGIMIGLFIAATLHAQSNTPGVTGPSLSMEIRTFDFGSVPSDFRIIHIYRLKNAGTEPLRIIHLQPNCDCTSASVKDTLIKPGDSTDLRLTFLTRDYYGTTSKRLTIQSNDPLQPDFELEYIANIDYFHKLHTSEPKYLTFLQGQSAKMVKLLNNSKDDVQYTVYKEPDTLFTLDKSSGSIDPESAETVNVTINNNLRPGTYFSNFTVIYSTQPILRLTIPVKVVRF